MRETAPLVMKHLNFQTVDHFILTGFNFSIIFAIEGIQLLACPSIETSLILIRSSES